MCVCMYKIFLSLTRHPYKQIYFYVCKLNTYVCVCGSDGKESACNEGDLDSILGLGRSPGEGNGNPLQYSCLENSMDRGALQATVHGFAESDD